MAPVVIAVDLTFLTGKFTHINSSSMPLMHINQNLSRLHQQYADGRFLCVFDICWYYQCLESVWACFHFDGMYFSALEMPF